MILCYICKRFKSSSSNDRAKVIRRLHCENLSLFGKLLESASVKRRRLKKVKSHFEGTNVRSTKSAGETLLQSTREEVTQQVVTPRKNVFEETSKSSIQTDVSSRVSRITSNKPVPVTTKINTLASFPLINPCRKKYIANNDNEIKHIGRISNYYRDYKSVSEILSKSMSSQSKMNLERWKTRMISELGEEGFQSFNRNQMLRGSQFRNLILQYLGGVSEGDLEISDELKSYWSSAKAVFSLFPNVVGCGGLVAHQDLKYKGVFDCLAVFRNEVMLVSWKKSEKYVPSLDRTFDIPLQIAAYMGALNFDDRYPFRVEQALLVMAYNDGSKADLFHLNEQRCTSYWKQWLERYDIYLKRIEEEAKHEKEKTESEPQVITDSPEKLDIDWELKKKASGVQFSPQIIKESKDKREEEERVENLTQLYPLINSQKSNYDSAKDIIIEPSVEYQNNLYPSVSSILSETKSEASKYILEQWRRSMIEKLGQEAFEKYEKETLECGSTLHEYIRLRFSGSLKDDVEIPKSVQGFWRSLSSVFPLISNVQITESTVAHPVCKYRGIIDCIGFYQNQLVLIDWKTSEKIKPIVSSTYDAPIQIAAYIGAVNFDSSYPFKVEEGLIVVAYNDGTQANVFHLNKEKCHKYWRKWLDRLNKYQTMAYENGTKIRY